MKLFIWEGGGVLEDYTSGMVVALAIDLPAALEAVRVKQDYALGSFPSTPTHVIDLPGCADIPTGAWLCWGGG